MSDNAEVMPTSYRYTVADVSKAFNVAEPTVRSWVRNKRIPRDSYFVVGRSYRFDLDALLRFGMGMSDENVAPPPPSPPSPPPPPPPPSSSEESQNDQPPPFTGWHPPAQNAAPAVEDNDFHVP